MPMSARAKKDSGFFVGGGDDGLVISGIAEVETFAGNQDSIPDLVENDAGTFAA